MECENHLAVEIELVGGWITIWPWKRTLGAKHVFHGRGWYGPGFGVQRVR